MPRLGMGMWLAGLLVSVGLTIVTTTPACDDKKGDAGGVAEALDKAASEAKVIENQAAAAKPDRATGGPSKAAKAADSALKKMTEQESLRRLEEAKKKTDEMAQAMRKVIGQVKAAGRDTVKVKEHSDQLTELNKKMTAECDALTRDIWPDHRKAFELYTQDKLNPLAQVMLQAIFGSGGFKTAPADGGEPGSFTLEPLDGDKPGTE